MRPIVNRQLLRFIDLYEYYDHEPDDNHPAGFTQIWHDSPFYDASVPETYIYKTYYQLLGKYYVTPFAYLDERHIHLAVMKDVQNYLPNLIQKLETLETIYNLDLDAFTITERVTSNSQNSSTSQDTAQGFNNLAKTPNTQASPSIPILDNITQQDNHNNSSNSTSNSTGNQQSTKLTGTDTALQKKLASIVDGLWDEFIKRFEHNFGIVYYGTFDYLYRNIKGE